MTDYKELSYLRELARDRQAEIVILKDFKADVQALTFLIMEERITLAQAENDLFKIIQIAELRLNTLKK